MHMKNRMFNGLTFSEWIQADAGMSAESYSSQILQPSVWGGGLEMAMVAEMTRRPVVVYQTKRGTSTAHRIATFRDDLRGAPMYLLYVSKNHYAALFRTE